VPLPPRAPELNGQQNIWQFMRQNWLSNRIFKSFDDIVDHCCYAWNTLIDQAGRSCPLHLTSSCLTLAKWETVSGRFGAISGAPRAFRKPRLPEGRLSTRDLRRNSRGGGSRGDNRVYERDATGQQSVTQSKAWYNLSAARHGR
jgi:hypothetical protein